MWLSTVRVCSTSACNNGGSASDNGASTGGSAELDVLPYYSQYISACIPWDRPWACCVPVLSAHTKTRSTRHMMLSSARLLAPSHCVAIETGSWENAQTHTSFRLICHVQGCTCKVRIECSQWRHIPHLQHYTTCSNHKHTPHLPHYTAYSEQQHKEHLSQYTTLQWVTAHTTSTTLYCIQSVKVCTTFTTLRRIQWITT